MKAYMRDFADCSGWRPLPLEQCAVVGCQNTRHKMSEFCEKHARQQPEWPETADG